MPLPNVYDLGDVVRLSAAFVDSDGTAIDPTTVSFVILSPDDTTTTYVYGVDVGVVKDSVGNYHIDIAIDAVKLWYVRVVSTGTGAAAAEGAFLVSESEFD